MRIMTDKLDGRNVTINIVESEADLPQFVEFVKRNRKALAFDTETTGLKMYTKGYRIRLAQFGTDTESYVIPVDTEGNPGDWALMRARVKQALMFLELIIIQNASFDLQVVEQTLGIRMEDLWHKVMDTKILAHLVDPRAKKDGGPGLKLEELTEHYLDPEVAKRVKGSMAEIAKSLKCKKDDVWWKVNLDHDGYLLYAGFDPILTFALFRKLIRMVPASARRLIKEDHETEEIYSYVSRTGMLLDVEYAEEECARLQNEEMHYNKIAEEEGVENVNSTAQVAEALLEQGIEIPGRTPTGKYKVDGDFLESIMDKSRLAEAIILAKRASKQRTTWLEAGLNNRDSNDRIHVSINGLAARTSRSSITGDLAAQTLPSGGWRIRRAYLADEGHVMVSIDYKTQELRILAGYTRDPLMLKAFENDEDLHQITADAAEVSRKIGKMTNFLTVYGGGAPALMTQGKVTREVADRVIGAFKETYKGYARYAENLTKQARMKGHVTLPSGRVLPVDRARAYSAINYEVQGGSADFTKDAVKRLHRAGFTEYIRLPVHDEIVFSFPKERAEELSKQAAETMADSFKGVYVGTDPEIGWQSWGSLYMSPEEKLNPPKEMR